MKSLNKFWRIVKSRFQKEIDEDWIKLRRERCASCEYNSLNRDYLSFKERLYKVASDLYTKITFSEYHDLGECECTCSIFHKTRDPYETCHAAHEYNDDKWKSIYIPNKK